MIAGLKPYPRMKNSGVKWLGEVPVGWEIRPNGRIFAQRIEAGFPDLPILEVSLRTGVRGRDLDTGLRKQMMRNRGMYKRATRRDIAYNMMRTWQGAVGVVPVDGLVSPAYVVAQPFSGMVPDYFDVSLSHRWVLGRSRHLLAWNRKGSQPTVLGAVQADPYTVPAVR